MMGADMKDHEGQIHVQLAGGASKALKLEEVQSLMKWARKEKGGHVTRIDLALDDRAGLLNVDEIERAIEAGKMVTRSRECNIQKSGKLGSGWAKSIYIGSPESKTRHVIYDKAAEQEKKGKPVEGPWVRVETRYQDERADVVVEGLCSVTEENLWMVCMAYLVKTLDFREITPEMRSWDRARAERVTWWALFTESIKGVALHVQQPAVTVQKIAQWVSESVSASLAVLCGHKDFGQEWLEQVMLHAAMNLKPKHLAMFQQRVPAMGQV